jgi:hypothetical protein
MNKALILTILFLLSGGTAANAQQTVFNVPSADVLEKGKVYAELDAAFKFNRQTALGRFSSFVPRLVVGAGRNVEVGLNVLGNIQPGPDATTLVPTAKWKFFEDKNRGIRAIAGTNIYIPVRNRSYNVGTWSYAAVVKSFRRTRLTGGGYVASRNVFAPKATRLGGQFAIEHTLSDKAAIAADWITGRHANGYFTPGLIYKPAPSVTAYFAYSIGNEAAAKGNHFFLFELGYNFN